MDRRISVSDVFLSLASFILLIISGFINKNTYDSGDSLMHYFYSHYSWQYPGFFMHHWGKPLFILLSSPFAHFGFIGMKFFQALCWSSALYLTLKVLPEKMKLQKWLVFIAFLFAPKVILSVSSGLTEPLFAILLLLVIYFSFKNRQIVAAVVCSFLPFARSEGMIILLVFLAFLFVAKAWKAIPFLLVGNIIYGISGWFYFKDILWYYHQNPYNVVVEKYGSGTLLHYIDQLQYITGLPLYILFFAGFLGLVYNLSKTKLGSFNAHQFFVIYGFAVAFISAHSFFWWKGFYGSFGLNRVLLCVFPCVVLIGISGFSFLENAFSTIHFNATKIFRVTFIIYWIVFPFTGNNAGFDLQKDFSKSDDQQLTDEAVSWMKENYSTNSINVSAPYTALASDQCPFNLSTGDYLGFLSPDKYSPGSIYIWENWFSPKETGISESFITDSKQYKLLKCFDRRDRKKITKICLYQRL